MRARLAEGGGVGDGEAGLLDEDAHEDAGDGELALQRRKAEARRGGDVGARPLLLQLRQQLLPHAPVPNHLNVADVPAVWVKTTTESYSYTKSVSVQHAPSRRQRHQV